MATPARTGPNGVRFPRQHVDGILDRIEAGLTEFANLSLPLDQRERLERAIIAAHTDNMTALRRRIAADR
jgi:hypothetical protein